MTDDAPMDIATDKPRPWFGFFLRPGFLLAVAPFLNLAIAALTYRSTRFAGIPPIDEIVDRETEGRVDIKPEENAFTYYQHAWKQLPATLDDEAIGDAVDMLDAGGDWSDVTPAARIGLDSCETVLAEWKRGTECDRGVRVQAADAEWYDLIGVQRTRAISRLVILISARCLYEGDANEAWHWLRALFRFSRHLGNPGPLMDRSIGYAFHAMGIKSLVYWAANDRVTASQLKTAIHELNAIYQMTAPYSLVLKHDYLSTSRLLSQPSRLRETYIFQEAVPEGLESACGIYLFVNGEPQLADLLLRHVTANLLSQCNRPRWARIPATGGFRLFEPSGLEKPPLMNVNALENALVRSRLAQHLGSNSGLLDWTDREQSQQAALELCLTAELFRREHGRYPESLEELVPEFLAEIPRDLYGTTSDECMLMTRRKDSDVEDESEKKDFYSGPGLVIYSRGENGIDDGGEIRRADIGLKIPAKADDD